MTGDRPHQMEGGSSFDKLFTPPEIRGVTLKNRIFSTGHMAVMLDDGKPSTAMVAYKSRLKSSTAFCLPH